MHEIYSRNSTHTCNQWEFNTKCQSFMHVDKPKDQDLAGHVITKFNLISFLTFLKTNIQEASLFPRVNTNLNFSLTLLSFLLRKELGSSLKSPLSNPRVHTPKERQSPTPKSISLIFSWLLLKVQLLFFFLLLLFLLAAPLSPTALPLSLKSYISL